MTKETILQAVSEVTGVSKEDILSGTKEGQAVFARYLSVVYCRLYNTGSIAEIMSFHNRCYSNYWNTVKTLKNDIETNKAKWTDYHRVSLSLQNIELIPQPKRELPILITEDFSDDEYQDISEEALKFQTNQ
jgi:hypothetical protein